MVNLVIDTDIGNDCDDAAAVALACMYEKRGICRLLCVTVNTSDPYAADCIDSIAVSYGNKTEVGVYRGKGFPPHPASYCRAVAERFGSISGKERREAVALLREKLGGSADRSVTLACIGQLNNLRALLESEADGFGEDGVSLVSRKVREVVVMGGMFTHENVVFEGKPYTAEFNIAAAVEDSIETLRLCPVNIVFSDFLLGLNVVSLGGLTYSAQSDPVGYAYELFCGRGKGRPSWDLLTVMYAVEGVGAGFGLSEKGTVSVDRDGKTEFTPDCSGKHRLLKAAASCDDLRGRLEEWFVRRYPRTREANLTEI